MNEKRENILDRKPVSHGVRASQRGTAASWLPLRRNGARGGLQSGDWVRRMGPPTCSQPSDAVAGAREGTQHAHSNTLHNTTRSRKPFSSVSLSWAHWTCIPFARVLPASPLPSSPSLHHRHGRPCLWGPRRHLRLCTPICREAGSIGRGMSVRARNWGGRRGCGIGEQGREAREGGIWLVVERAEVDVCLGLGDWSGAV